MKKRLLIGMLALALCLAAMLAASALADTAPSLRVNKTTLQYNENVTVYVQAPGATAVRIWNDFDREWRYFDHYRNLKSFNEGIMCWDDGTWVVKAEYITVGYDDGIDWYEEAEDYIWTQIGQPITLTVGQMLGTLNPPSASLAATSVARGDTLSLTIDSLQNKDEWYFLELEKKISGQWENVPHWHVDLPVEAGVANIIPTVNLEPGSYRLKVFCEAVNYDQNETALPFAVTANTDALPDMALYFRSSEELSFRQICFFAYAQGADHLEVEVRMEGNPDWRNWMNEEGELARFDWSSSDEGVYTFRLRAWQDGVERTLDSAFTLTQTAPHGSLNAPVIRGIPGVLAPGEGVDGTFSTVSNAGDYHIRLEYREEDGDWEEVWQDFRHNDNPDMNQISIPGDCFSEPGYYWLQVHCHALGYNGGHANQFILVQESATPQLTLTVNGGTDDINDLLSYQNVMINVDVPQEVTAVRLLNNDWWEAFDAREFHRYHNLHWNFGPGSSTVLAQATTDPAVWREDGFDWGSFNWDEDVDWTLVSNAVTVRCVAPNGTLENPQLTMTPANGQVTRGDWLTVTAASQDHGEWMWAELYSVDDSDPFDPRWDFVEHYDVGGGLTLRIPTLLLEPGEYALRIGMDAVGWQGRQTTAYFTVNAGATLPQAELLFDREAMQAGEDMRIYAWAPGAEYMELDISWDRDPNWWDHRDGGGDQVRWNWGCGCGGEYTFTLRVHYPEGSGEQDFEVVRTFSVTSEGKLEEPVVSGIPTVLLVGETVHGSFQAIDDAQWYNVELNYCPDEGDWQMLTWDERDPSDTGATSIDLDGSLFAVPGRYRLSVNAQTVGVDNGFTELWLTVLPAGDGEDIITNIQPEYLSQDRPYIAIRAPGATHIDVWVSGTNPVPENDDTLWLSMDGDSAEDFIVFSAHEGKRYVKIKATMASGATKTRNYEVTVNAPYGDLWGPRVWMDDIWTQGQALNFRVDPMSALFIYTEITDKATGNVVYEDEDLNFDDWSYSIPANQFTPGRWYSLYIYSTQVGYNYNETTFDICMLPSDAATLTLPAALMTVEPEAFAGVAAQRITLPDTVNSIAAGAFANCPNLILVDLPSNCEGIDADAFTGSGPLMAYGEVGSSAEAYTFPSNEFNFIYLNP